MNLSKIFQMQKELDEAISQRNDLTKASNQKYHIMRILATLVETAEFANEVQTFKYWKAKKNVDRSKALEEFADILHFLGSIAYKHKVDPIIKPLIMSKDVNMQIVLLFATISNSASNMNKYVISEMLALALGTAKLLGYSEEELEESYYIKNRKNYERINSKY